jgi:hypothetical protein
LDHVTAVPEIKMQEDFSIGTRNEPVAELLKIPAKLTIVINLAVENDPCLAIGGCHGLGTGFAQIDYRKATVGKAYALAGRDP